jgi:hypothetical protein
LTPYQQPFQGGTNSSYVERVSFIVFINEWVSFGVFVALGEKDGDRGLVRHQELERDFPEIHCRKAGKRLDSLGASSWAAAKGGVEAVRSCHPSGSEASSVPGAAHQLPGARQFPFIKECCGGGLSDVPQRQQAGFQPRGGALARQDHEVSTATRVDVATQVSQLRFCRAPRAAEATSWSLC